jgi:hypothetical protein
MGIKLFNSSPYHAQANGQAEASNKIMIKLIQKKIDQKPKRWHLVLNEALWAYRMSPHGATKTSPYELVYGHHVVLPWEIQSDSGRVVLQKDLSSKYYSGLMMDELEDLHMIRLKALDRGAYPEKFGRWRGFLNRIAVGSFGIQVELYSVDWLG